MYLRKHDGGVGSAGQGRLLEEVTRKGRDWSWALTMLDRDLPSGASSTGKNSGEPVAV